MAMLLATGAHTHFSWTLAVIGASMDKAEMIEIDEFIRSSLKAIIKSNGEIYVEQKFPLIFNTLEKTASTDAFEGKLNEQSRKNHYEFFFPNLAPKLKNLEAVYEHSLRSTKDFNFLFHPSENIYRSWLLNNKEIDFSNELLTGLINEYENWTINTKSRKQNLETYEPEYPKRNYIIGNVDSITLNSWLDKIGITLSMTTCQFLLEFGLPYCGYLVKPQNLFHFGGRTKSVIGLLAHNLNDYKNGYKRNPLKESIILALARLEFYNSTSTELEDYRQQLRIRVVRRTHT